MKKAAGIVVLLLSVVTGIYLTCFSGNPVRYSECIVSKEQYDEIMTGRIQNSGLFHALVFEEETLMSDS